VDREHDALFDGLPKHEIVIEVGRTRGGDFAQVRVHERYVGLFQR
jgi:hypothetical protein